MCWNADKTAIIRSAATVSPGDRVQVTLADGEIGCRVETNGPRLSTKATKTRRHKVACDLRDFVNFVMKS